MAVGPWGSRWKGQDGWRDLRRDDGTGLLIDKVGAGRSDSGFRLR